MDDFERAVRRAMRILGRAVQGAAGPIDPIDEVGLAADPAEFASAPYEVKQEAYLRFVRLGREIRDEAGIDSRFEQEVAS